MRTTVFDARILIVDDQRINVLLLEKILSLAGYRNLRSCTDSREALKLFDEERADLVLLDLNMPHMSGFEVLEQLKSRIGDGQYLAVLVVTAQTDRKTRVRALQAGATDFLSRPFSREEALSRVRNQLNNWLLTHQLSVQLTIHRDTEKRLSDSEERFDLATQAADEGIWDWNLRTGQVYLSPRWKALLGYAEDELPNTIDAWSSRVHPEDLSQAMVDLENYLDGKLSSYDKTVRVRHRDGRYRWFNNRWMAVRDTSGSAVRIVGITDDITEDVYLHEQLTKALERAEAATRAKGEFLANMSHEIRTPMNAVLGLAHLLESTGLNSEQHDYLRKIRSSAHALLGVLNDILDFSKIEAGRLGLEQVQFNLGEVVQQAFDLASGLVGDKAIELRIVRDPGLPGNLLGDPLRLGQVLSNLLNNAVKFTTKGEVLLRVEELEPEDGNQDRRIRFRVRDTGIGMSKAEVGRLFEPFAQADTTTTRRFGGSGLGLAISRQLVHLMGGEIGVDSTPGEGSEFRFTLVFPFSGENAEGPALETTKPDKQPLPDLTPIRGARVLLVDDHALNREVAYKILRNAGMTVETAENGQQALERVLSPGDPLDAVFMDIQMPGMDGHEASRRIREVRDIEELPIFAMTAHAMAGDRENSLRAGMNDHLVKPIDLQALYTCLLRWISPRAPGEAPPPPPPTAPASTPERRIGELKQALQCLDLDEALERIDHDLDMFLRLLADFRSNTPPRVREIRAAMDRKQWDVAQRLSHTIKGLSAYVGAKRVLAAAQALDSTLKAGRTGEAEELWAELHQSVTELSEAAASVAANRRPR